jgi:hypothetical protein
MLTQLGSTSGADEPVRTRLSTTVVAMFIYSEAMFSATLLSALHRMARNMCACDITSVTNAKRSVNNQSDESNRAEHWVEYTSQRSGNIYNA